ncbi:MAG: serine/threonine protein kinase [Candidatus Omnitrophica bacterium]|nr:serine/threonine protein kinase [Candidatus Omnitrophota bacterium]
MAEDLEKTKFDAEIKDRKTIPLIGRSIGKYRVTGFLGSGAMASVYKAEESDGTIVALKLIEESPLISRSIIERFEREAEATKILRKHPNIITVYDTGHEGIVHYIAMECVENGRTLAEKLEDGRLSESEAIEIAIQLARALDYAHEHGIVHRDIKPGNVMINEFGAPLLTDFGLVKPEGKDRMTATGAILGTPIYMPPEQTRGEKVDMRSDIYSLGIILYEMLTGHVPFEVGEGETVQDLMNRIRDQEPPSPRKHNRKISGRLEAIVLKAIEKSPSGRYQSAGELLDDLTRYTKDEPVRARKPSITEYFERSFRRHLGIGLSVTSSIILVLVISLWWKHQVSIQKNQALITEVQKKGLARELYRLKEGGTGKTPEDSALLNEARSYQEAARLYSQTLLDMDKIQKESTGTVYHER